MLSVTTLGRSIQTTTRTTSAVASRANSTTKLYSPLRPFRSFQTTSRKMVVHNISSKSEFDQVRKDNQVVVVDFFATWCGPCKIIAPQLVSYSEQYKNAHFVKVDVDEVSDVAQEYSIRAMPTFLILKDGEKVDEVVGANPPAIQAAIEKYTS